MFVPRGSFCRSWACPRLGWLALGTMLILSIWLLARFAWKSGRIEKQSPGHSQILYYADPMHPSFQSDRPGVAPDCGMNLEPVYAKNPMLANKWPHSGSVQLSSEQERAINLQTETLRLTTNTRRLQTVGRVAAMDDHTYRISAGVDGWVRWTSGQQAGTNVEKGQRLAAFYSKDALTPQQAFLYAQESYERLRHDRVPKADQLALAARQLATTRDNLQFLGIDEAQILELGQSHQELANVLLIAPCTGLILERNMLSGQRFMKGDLLYRIADLSSIWIIADVDSLDIPLLPYVTEILIRAPGLPEARAKKSEQSIQFSAETGTGKFRVALSNKMRTLIPSMLVDVALEIAGRSALTLDTNAVLDSGTRRHVFVAKGDGQYDLREVETGWQYDNRVEIKSGLVPGERVVTAGVFLLDSESQIKGSGDQYGKPESDSSSTFINTSLQRGYRK